MYFEHPYYPNKYEQYENKHHPSAILNAIQILLGSIQLNVVFFCYFFPFLSYFGRKTQCEVHTGMRKNVS